MKGDKEESRQKENKEERKRHSQPGLEEVDNIGFVSHQEVILASGMALRLHQLFAADSGTLQLHLKGLSRVEGVGVMGILGCRSE